MIHTLFVVLVAGLVLYLIYYVAGLVIKGQPRNLIGVILGLAFLVYALRAFDVVST
jgi:hypothetical protein